MPDYKKLARQAAGEVGVDPHVFTSLVRAESRFNPGARSPVGAQGLTQLMPGTARGLATKYGIDPATPYGNLLGGAYYLKEQIERFGDLRSAVAAYNAGPGAVEKYGGIPPYKETQAYVRNVLGGYNTKRVQPMSTPPPTAQAQPQPRRSGLQNALIATLAQIGQDGGYVDSNTLLHNVVGGIQMDRVSDGPRIVSGGSGPSSSSSPTSTSRFGRITVRSGANRPDMKLQPDVLAFARKVAGVYGKPLEIGTGTNHNRYVVGTRRQSAHWTGHAADIPASGQELTRMGRAALVAAGMSPEKASRVNGGLFNVGGYQVIFNSMTGGNHYNHLHIGIRG